jgi:Flp pilus assembly protein TadB
MAPNLDVEQRSSRRRSDARASSKRVSKNKSTSVRKSTSKRSSVSKSTSVKRSSRRTSTKRSSRRLKRSKSGETNVFRSAWMVVMPFVVTVWTGTAVMWALIFTWLQIKIRKATRKNEDQIAASKETWSFLHECTSFLAIGKLQHYGLAQYFSF